MCSTSVVEDNGCDKQYVSGMSAPLLHDGMFFSVIYIVPPHLT